MGLLTRILPIADDLKASQAAVEGTLRDLTYSTDREAVVKQLRGAAASADQAAYKARELAKAMESGFGTLPEVPPAPLPALEATSGDDDDGA